MKTFKIGCDDPPYLARIIFCEMIQDDVLGETGYGIAPTQDDENHPDIVVDLEANTVSVRRLKPVPFKEYIK